MMITHLDCPKPPSPAWGTLLPPCTHVANLKAAARRCLSQGQDNAVSLMALAVSLRAAGSGAFLDATERGQHVWRLSTALPCPGVVPDSVKPISEPEETKLTRQFEPDLNIPNN